MKRIIHGLALLFCAFCLSVSFGAIASLAAGMDDYPTTPTKKPDGSKWRLGYLEGGYYPDYPILLRVTVEGLQNRGWLKVEDMPANVTDHKQFWEWLADNAQSDYLEFVKDAYYAPGDFDKALRPEVKKQVIERLNTKKDIDLMLALGTWAGQDLANTEHSVPVVVESCSDPLGSGIIQSVEDSGLDHVHAKVEPDRYPRQIRLFHDIVPFQKLGIVYEDSTEGRTFAAVDIIKRAADDLGFEIVECHAPFNNVEKAEAEAGVVKCYEELASQVDAVYITVHRGVNANSLPKLLAPLYANKIPTFSMLGSGEVRHGVLMSIAQAGFRYVGQFHADVIAKIFNGAKPRELSQEWQDPPKIALNMKVAEIIGYDPPVDIMMAADEIYEDIASPKTQE